MFRPPLRVLLIASLLAALAVGLPVAYASAAGATEAAPAAAATPSQLATDAYDYGIPLMEFLRTAKQQTSVTVPNALSDAPINQLGNARHLATAQNHVIVQPNNDTLYTMGHLDLTAGPLVLHVPHVPNHRYYSFEFLDPYTNVFHYVGTRTTGEGPGNFAIVGPRFKGKLPRGLRRINSAYERVWVVGRTLVNGPSDLPAVHRVQDGYKLIPLAKYKRFGLSWHPPRPHRIITKHTTYTEPTGLAFFDALGDALAQNPPPARDQPILRELATVGDRPRKASLRGEPAGGDGRGAEGRGRRWAQPHLRLAHEGRGQLGCGQQRLVRAAAGHRPVRHGL